MGFSHLFELFLLTYTCVYSMHGRHHHSIRNHSHPMRNHSYAHESCDYCSSATSFPKGGNMKPNIGTFHVVDVFLVVARPQDYKYISNGNFWIGPQLMQALSKNNDTRVHIFTDTDDIMVRGTMLGYYMYDMGKEPFVSLNKHFFEMYEKNHHSINNVEYEYLCFYRWHMFRKVVELWENQVKPITRILTIDTDVVMLTNAAEFFHNAVAALHIDQADNSFEVITISHGAVHLWTAAGLHSYSNFIYQWYNKSQADVLHTTKQNAGYLYKRLHFSDMQMVGVYMRQSGKNLRNPCFAEPSLVNIWRRNPNQGCLFDTLGCIPMSRYDDMMHNNSVSWVNHRPQGRDERYPYCLMHFQGDNAKQLLAVYGRFYLNRLKFKGGPVPYSILPPDHGSIEHEQSLVATDTGIELTNKPIDTMISRGSNISNSSSPNIASASKVNLTHWNASFWAYKMADIHRWDNAPLLLKTKSSNDVFYYQHGHRRHIPSFDMFQALNFTGRDICNTPPELMEAIPLGPEMTEPED